MKKKLILLFMITIAGTISTFAQNTLEASLQQAKTENKHVLLIFSGSDWCRPCMILKKTILNTEEFQQFSKKELILHTVDFPQKKANQLSKEQSKINEQLAEKYNKKGQFPTLILLDQDGKQLNRMSYKKMPVSQYVEHYQQIIK